MEPRVKPIISSATGFPDTLLMLFIEGTLKKKMQYGYTENFPNLQVLFSFCLAVSSQFISLAFYYRQQEETRLCLQHLEIPSAKYLSSSHTNSAFHKNTMQPSSSPLYNKNHFLPVSNSISFVSI